MVDVGRQRELDVCLLQNLANPYISQVHILLEKHEHVETLSALMPEAFVHKLHLHMLGHRPTFKDAFEYAGTHLSGQLCMLANADVFFDHSLSRLYPPNALHLQDEVSRVDARL